MTNAPMTKRTAKLLVHCARLMGEPESPFTLEDLEDYTASVNDPYSLEGMQKQTIPALKRRGFVTQLFDGRWQVTDRGFHQAMHISGGYGLL